MALQMQIPGGTYTRLVEGLDGTGIGYIHLVEAVGGGLPVPPVADRLTFVIRAKFNGALMLNRGGSMSRPGMPRLRRGKPILSHLASRSLPIRIFPSGSRKHAPLNREYIATFYTGVKKKDTQISDTASIKIETAWCRPDTRKVVPDSADNCHGQCIRAFGFPRLRAIGWHPDDHRRKCCPEKRSQRLNNNPSDPERSQNSRDFLQK
jgi:hypothetical protein